MTVQEAIKVIETHFCDKCIMTICEYCAHGKAKEALEKQIPKKPHENKNEYYCPNCYIGFDWDTETNLKGNVYQYCPYCGQAIDKF